MPIPEKLQELLDTLASIPDRTERIQALISIAEEFRPVNVPLPLPEERRVPGCESEAFVFPSPRGDGSLDFNFVVENPQGVSAMALAQILHDTLSGAPLERILEIPNEIVFDIFGRELSMGKSMGLINMLQMVKADAKRQLAGDTA